MKIACNRGFSLVELVVVVLVLGILMTLALPAYQQQLRTSRRSLAGAALLEALIRQEQFFLQHRQYAQGLTDLGYPAQRYAIDAQGNTLTADAPHRIYLINLATRVNSFTLSAIPQLGQAKDRLCGTLSLESTGTKRVSGPGSLSQCW
jgi:type IV pilus assembly protein PilE